MISIIIPVLNELSNLDNILLRLIKVLDKYENYEILFIDDGSTDGTKEKLVEICKFNHFCKAIFFDKNYGHQMALLAGFQNSLGQIVITIDGDLSDPPELIDDLIITHSKGFDIVNTVRIRRENEKLWRIIFIKAFYFFSDIFGLGLINNSGDFRLMNRESINILTNLKYKKFFVRALVPKIKLNQFNFKYNRKPRNSGKPKGNFVWLCIFGIDCLIALNILPKKMSFTSNNFKIQKIL